MNGSEFSKANHEKDFGVTISNNLKPGKHCSDVVKKANKLVGFIGRTFEYKSEKVILTLYNALVRPHLEYCIEFWSPYYRKILISWIEYKKRITKMIPRLRNKSYKERLRELNLFSSSKRRLQGDLIEVFKIFHGFDNININDCVTTDLTSTTDNNGFKIIGKRFRSNGVKPIFFNTIPKGAVTTDRALCTSLEVNKPMGNSLMYFGHTSSGSRVQASARAGHFS